MDKSSSREERGEEGGKGVGGKENKETMANKELIQNRVVVSKEANNALEQLRIRVCDGINSVQITKSDIANYVFCNLQKLISDSDIKTLRNIHFDEFAVLKKLLKDSQSTDELPNEIKRMVREYCGVTDKEKKKTTKGINEII